MFLYAIITQVATYKVLDTNDPFLVERELRSKVFLAETHSSISDVGDKAMKNIMKGSLCFYVVGVLIVATTGCASHSILDSLSEDSNHSFRDVRWGYSQERVELAEAGNTVYERTENALVYRHKINGVDCLLIYTFKDNKLRTAGYVTQTPVNNVDNIIKEAVDSHGMPTTVNATEMVWKNTDTVIYANVYDSVKKVTQTRYQHTSGGLLREVLQRNLAKRGKEGLLHILMACSHTLIERSMTSSMKRSFRYQNCLSIKNN